MKEIKCKIRQFFFEADMKEVEQYLEWEQFSKARPLIEEWLPEFSGHCFDSDRQERLFIALQNEKIAYDFYELDYCRLFMNYAIVLLYEGKVENCRKALIQAQEWNPMNAKARYAYCALFLAKGKLKDFYQETVWTLMMCYEMDDIVLWFDNLLLYCQIQGL